MRQSDIGVVLVAILGLAAVALLVVCLVAMIASALGRAALDDEVRRLMEAGVRIVNVGGAR